MEAAVDVESLATAAATEEDTELLFGLQEALETLPERQRHALLLREWRGLSALEIAEQLHLSPPATHALLTRARRSLAHALTAPQRAALGVASLVYELRSWLKVALGSASAKAATVATVAVVGAGIGGVVVDQSIAGGHDSRPSVESAQSASAGPGGGRVGAASRTTAVGSSAGSPASAPGMGAAARESGLTSSSGRRRASGPAQTIRGRTRPDATAEPGSIPAPTPDVPGTPGAGPLAGVSVDPLASPNLPPADLPPVELPPVDVSPVDLPPLDLPPVDLSPGDLPAVDLPPVDLPPVDVSPADLPPVDVPPVVPPPVPPLP